MGALTEYERELIRERTEMAAQELREGRHVKDDILPAVQALDGPKVRRSALYP